LKSRWLKRRETAFHSIVLPPTPRLRSESNPTLPGRIVGICRLGKSNGIACVLKSVRVFTRGPPSTMATRTPRLARCAARVPPAAPDPTMTTSKLSFCISGICAYDRSDLWSRPSGTKADIVRLSHAGVKNRWSRFSDLQTPRLSGILE
jgi:hypothetical protein